MSFKKYQNLLTAGNRRPVYVDGLRSAFVKSFGAFEDCDTLELFSRVVDGLVKKVGLDPNEIDEIMAGVVVPQTKNPNVARDAILNLNLPRHIHGYTLNRACTSSLQTVANAAQAIAFGQPQITLAGGVECLSDVPIVYSKKARKFLVSLSKAKSPGQKLSMLTDFSAGAWLPKPPALAEPLTGYTMGEHCEMMAKINEISRESQDEFAAASHAKAAAAQEKGYLAEEILPIWPSPKYKEVVDKDNIIRNDTSAEALSKLRPAFDRKYGTITAGNASSITDGASIALIADEQRAKSLGLTPKTLIRDILFVGVEPTPQLLIGPAIAIPLLLKRNGIELKDVSRFEVHEAFAAQVLSCLKSMNSASFNEKHFGVNKAFGEIDPDKLNVNGGAIAIGHPFGATGTRLLTSISNELHRCDGELGVIAICAAGGMSGAMLVERI